MASGGVTGAGLCCRGQRLCSRTAEGRMGPEQAVGWTSAGGKQREESGFLQRRWCPGSLAPQFILPVPGLQIKNGGW